MPAPAALRRAFAATGRPVETAAAWARVVEAAGPDAPRDFPPESAAVLARLLAASD